MRKPKYSKDTLEFIHTLDSIAIKKQKEEIDSLKSEVERLTEDNEQLQNRCDFLEGKPSV